CRASTRLAHDQTYRYLDIGFRVALAAAGARRRISKESIIPLAFKTPGFDQWVKEVAAKPAEEQVEAVGRKLQELNKGFDGMVTPTIEGGVVTGLQFVTDNVTDISPVRALKGLKTLVCRGSAPGMGKLDDLSPLAGMPVGSLDISCTNIADLVP